MRWGKGNLCFRGAGFEVRSEVARVEWMRLNFEVGMRAMKRRLAVWGLAVVLGAGVCGCRAGAAEAAAAPLPDVSKTSQGAPHRTRLILKDGSYQIVMSYQVKGKIVSYVSAERGETEEFRPTWWTGTRPTSGSAITRRWMRWMEHRPRSRAGDRPGTVEGGGGPQGADAGGCAGPESAGGGQRGGAGLLPGRAGAGAAGAVGGRLEPHHQPQHSEAGDQSAGGAA